MAVARNENAPLQFGKTADSDRENIEPLAETAKDTTDNTLRAVSENAQHYTDQITEFFGLRGGKGEELTRQSAQNVAAVTAASTVLARGFQDLSKEWFGVVRERIQRNFDAASALARCQSVPDFVAVQSEVVRDSLEQSIEVTRRVAAVATRVASDASQTMASQATGTTRRVA
jgi:phasin family protein